MGLSARRSSLLCLTGSLMAAGSDDSDRSSAQVNALTSSNAFPRTVRPGLGRYLGDYTHGNFWFVCIKTTATKVSFHAVKSRRNCQRNYLLIFALVFSEHVLSSNSVLYFKECPSELWSSLTP